MTAPAFEEVPLERLSPGIFKANLAMFPDPAGLYVRLSDVLARECLWTPDADGYWKTACGQGHTFTTDGPTENNHRFCCYCGGRISMKENGNA